jgi:secreted PhoX family phosphatase
MSCEEDDDGQVWECDPTGAKPAVAHPAMGVFKHEAVAVDPVGQRLYLTEDLGDGGLYRFTPSSYPDCSAGLLEVAIVGAAGRVTWARVPDPRGGSANPTRKQVPGMTQFKRGEGIWFDRGVVYVSTTSDNVVHAYDTRSATLTRLYDAAAVAEPPLINPDNVTVNATSGEVFVGEDDGGDDPLDLCVITPEGTISRFLKLTGAMHGSGDAISEVTGPSFSPDGTRLYFSSQRAYGTGLLYEVTGPFRTTRPPEVNAPSAPPRPAIGFAVPRRVRRATALRSGIPVGLTLDAAANIDLRLTARLRTRPGGPVRTVVLARVKRKAGRGTQNQRLVLTKTAKKLLRARKRSLTATVELRVGGRTVRRKVVLT